MAPDVGGVIPQEFSRTVRAIQCGQSVDWGFPGAGARWVDTAFMVLRLIEAGHTPGEAEGWARARSTFAGVDERGLTAWAVYVAGLWTHIAVSNGQGSSRRARLARDYARWRLERV